MLLYLGVKAVVGYRISWKTMKVSKNSNKVIFSEFTLPMSTTETETETETEKLQLK